KTLSEHVCCALFASDADTKHRAVPAGEARDERHLHPLLNAGVEYLEETGGSFTVASWGYAGVTKSRVCARPAVSKTMATATLRGNAFTYRRCHRCQACDAGRCQGVAKTLVATNSPGGGAAMSPSEPAPAVFELPLVGQR